MLFRVRRTGHRRGKRPVGQILLEHNLICSDDLERAQSMAQEQGVSLEQTLLAAGFLSESVLTSCLTLEMGFPVIDVTSVCSDISALEAISKGAALAYKALPISITDGCLVVATGSPAYDRLRGLERLTGLKVREVVFFRGSIYEETLKLYHSPTSPESHLFRSGHDDDEECCSSPIMAGIVLVG